MTAPPRLRSSAQNVAALVLQSASTLVLLIVTSRVVGLEGVGTLAIAVTGFAVIVVVESAVVSVATRAVQRAPQVSVRHLVRDQARISTATLMAVVVALLGLGLLDAETAAVCAPVWLAAVLVVATAPVPAIVQAAARFDVLVLASAVGGGVAIVLAYPAVRAFGVLGAAGLFASSALIARGVVLGRARGLAVPRSTGQEPKRGRGLRSLLVLGGIGQVAALTDVALVRALADSAEAGRYRLGAQVPTLLAVVVYKGYDVVYPRLTAATGPDLPAELWRWNRLWALGTGGVLGTCVALREPIVRALVGRDDATTATVLAVFAAVWLANFAVHGVSLWLIAQQQHAVLVPVVFVEFVANVALTVAVVPRFGAVGCAYATLATLVLSNCIALPLLLRRTVPEVVVLVVRSSLLPAFAAAAAALVLMTAAIELAGRLA